MSDWNDRHDEPANKKQRLDKDEPSSMLESTAYKSESTTYRSQTKMGVWWPLDMATETFGPQNPDDYTYDIDERNGKRCAGVVHN